MKILRRYILAEHIGPFFLGVGIFSFILLLDKVFLLSDLFIAKRVDAGSIALLFFYYLPATLGVTVPMGTLLGVLMAWGRLSEDNEITAIRASGLSLTPLIVTSLCFGLFLSLATMIFNDTVLPGSNYAYRKLYRSIAQSDPFIGLEEGIFLRVGTREIYVDKVNQKNRTLSGIYIYEKGHTDQTIIARSGRWETAKDKSIILKLKNGAIHQSDSQDPAKYHILKFDSQTINLADLSKELDPANIPKGIRDMTAKEIRQRIKEYKEEQFNTDFLKVELHQKKSIPFACLAFSLIGVPLAIIIRKGGRSIGFGLSLALIFVYYLLLIGGGAVGKRGIINPSISVWIPNIFLGGIGIILIARKVGR